MAPCGKSHFLTAGLRDRERSEEEVEEEGGAEHPGARGAVAALGTDEWAQRGVQAGWARGRAEGERERERGDGGEEHGLRERERDGRREDEEGGDGEQPEASEAATALGTGG